MVCRAVIEGELVAIGKDGCWAPGLMVIFEPSAQRDQAANSSPHSTLEACKYIGRPENTKRNARIAKMLAAGTSYSDIQDATACSSATGCGKIKRCNCQ